MSKPAIATACAALALFSAILALGGGAYADDPTPPSPVDHR
jgi:hypothetical protein